MKITQIIKRGYETNPFVLEKITNAIEKAMLSVDNGDREDAVAISKIVIGTWVGARSQDIHFTGGLGSGSVLALPIAGNILSDIESNNTLRQKYLANFEIHNQTRLLLDCDPFYQKGLMGIINRARDKSEEEGFQKTDTEQDFNKAEEKKKSGFRRFFDRIFKGKKK